jgi:succinoglycan biosynthesis transport protein ExoP
MADTLAEVYIQKQTEQARADFAEAEKFIRARLDEVTAELDDAYGKLAQVQRETSVIDLDVEQRAAVARLSEFTTEREMVFARIKETESKLGMAKSFKKQESVDGGVSSSSMNSNPVIGKLRTQLADLHTVRQGLLLNHYTERAPEVVEVDAKIEGVKSQLAQALTEQHALDPELAAMEAELAGLLERQRALTEAIDRTQEQGTTYPELRRQFSRIQLQAAAAEEVYRALQDQAFQIGIAQAMTMADIRVTASAELPEDRSSPKTVLNVLAGLILGIAFGCASALVSEYLDDSIAAPEDVKEVWEVPVLGVLPRYKVAGGPALARISATDPLAEAHRALRNGIDFATLDKPARLLAVTSSIPGEGKSTLVMNLAISMASEGKKVLVVDADLRLPTQHRHYADLVSSPGLVEVITRSQQPQDAIQRTPVDGVDVLAAGALPPNPGHLVESLRMRQVLLELARSYDVVLVDTPPVLAVNDAVVLGRLVDGLLIVVEANRATRRMLTEVRARLEGARVAPTGLVLNKVRSGGLPYGEYTRYYQKQRKGNEPPTASSPPAAKGGAA